MNCTCGHHPHHHSHAPDDTGAPIALPEQMVALTGRLICADAAQMMTALTLLPTHADLSRAEPGCLRFDAWQDDDPLVWHISELFRDNDAFEAHQSRNRASQWGRDSLGIARDFHRRDLLPMIRPATRADAGTIAQLHGTAAAPADPALSLVATAAGTVIGHLHRPTANGNDIIAIHPKAHGLGLDTALLAQAETVLSPS